MHSLSSSEKNFYRRNITFSYLVDFFRALYFLIPVWVAFELRYISLSQLVVVEFVIFFSQMILELPTGAFADLLGKKVTIIFGSFITGFAFILFAHSTSFVDFIISATFIGLGEALISGSKEAFLFDSLKQLGLENTFDKINGRSNMIFQAGLAIATFAGGFLGEYYFRLPIYASAMAVIIGGLLAFIHIEPKIDTEKFTLKNYIRQTKVGFKEIFKTTYVAKLSLFYGLVGGISSVVSIVFTKILLVDLNYSESDMGVVFSLIRILNAFVLLFFIERTKFFTKAKSFLTFAIFIPVALIPGLAFGRYSSIIFVVLIMFLSSARHTLLNIHTNREFSSRNRATAISSLGMIVSFIYGGIVLASGPIMESFGGSKIIFSLLGLVSLFTITPLGLSLVRTNTKFIKIISFSERRRNSVD